MSSRFKRAILLWILYFLYFIYFPYFPSLNLLQYGVQASSRSQPRRAMRLLNFLAMGGGSHACTSSRPRCQASRSAAACSASSHCQRSRGVPARGSSSRYASAVKRNSAAPRIRQLPSLPVLGISAAPRIFPCVAPGFSPASRNADASSSGRDAALKGGATFASERTSFVTNSGLL